MGDLRWSLGGAAHPVVAALLSSAAPVAGCSQSSTSSRRVSWKVGPGDDCAEGERASIVIIGGCLRLGRCVSRSPTCFLCTLAASLVSSSNCNIWGSSTPCGSERYTLSLSVFSPSDVSPSETFGSGAAEAGNGRPSAGIVADPARACAVVSCAKCYRGAGGMWVRGCRRNRGR